jgi:hypothetical protein
MQQRVRPGRLLRDARSPGRIGEERHELCAQPIWKASVLTRRFDPRRGQRIERIDGVTEVLNEVLLPAARAVSAYFWQQAMMRGAGVKFGDELHSRADSLGIGTYGERLIAKVLVHMPDIVAARCGGDAKQTSAAIRQSERRQPSLCDELVSLSDGGFEALEYNSAPRDGIRDFYPIDARLEAMNGDDPIVAAEQLAQEIAELANGVFATRFQRVHESAAQMERVSHVLDVLMRRR